MSDSEHRRVVRHIQIHVGGDAGRSYGTITRKAVITGAGKDEHHEQLLIAVATDNPEQTTQLLCAYLTGSTKE